MPRIAGDTEHMSLKILIMKEDMCGSGSFFFHLLFVVCISIWSKLELSELSAPKLTSANPVGPSGTQPANSANSGNPRRTACPSRSQNMSIHVLNSPKLHQLMLKVTGNLEFLFCHGLPVYPKYPNLSTAEISNFRGVRGHGLAPF